MLEGTPSVRLSLHSGLFLLLLIGALLVTMYAAFDHYIVEEHFIFFLSEEEIPGSLPLENVIP